MWTVRLSESGNGETVEQGNGETGEFIECPDWKDIDVDSKNESRIWKIMTSNVTPAGGRIV